MKIKYENKYGRLEIEVAAVDQKVLALLGKES
jgi:hypothetical protein